VADSIGAISSLLYSMYIQTDSAIHINLVRVHCGVIYILVNRVYCGVIYILVTRVRCNVIYKLSLIVMHATYYAFQGALWCKLHLKVALCILQLGCTLLKGACCIL